MDCNPKRTNKILHELTITFSLPSGVYSWSVQIYVPENQETRYFAAGIGAANGVTVPTTTSQSINYIPQYKLTIDSAHGSPVGDDWYIAGTTANFSIACPDIAGETRYVFNAWTGNLTSTSANASVLMNSPKTVIANWQTQYYLTIKSLYGNPTGEGWYDAGSNAHFSVAQSSTDSSGTQYSLISWTGTGDGSYTGQSNTQTVTMNGPITETGNWEQSTSLWLVILIAAIIFALIAFLLAWRRRKNKEKPAEPTDEKTPS